MFVLGLAIGISVGIVISCVVFFIVSIVYPGADNQSSRI